MQLNYNPKSQVLLLTDPRGDAYKFSSEGIYACPQGTSTWDRCWPSDALSLLQRKVGRTAFKKALSAETPSGPGQGVLMDRGYPRDPLRVFLGQFSHAHVQVATRFYCVWEVLLMLHACGDDAASLADDHPMLALALSRIELFAPGATRANLFSESPEDIAGALGFTCKYSVLDALVPSEVTFGDLLAVRHLTRHNASIAEWLGAMETISKEVIDIVALAQTSQLTGCLLREVAETCPSSHLDLPVDAAREVDRITRELDLTLEPIPGLEALYDRRNDLRLRRLYRRAGLSDHPFPGRSSIQPIQAPDDLTDLLPGLGRTRGRGQTVSGRIESIMRWKKRLSMSPAAPMYRIRAGEETAIFTLENTERGWQIGPVISDRRRTSTPLVETCKAIRDWHRDALTLTNLESIACAPHS